MFSNIEFNYVFGNIHKADGHSDNMTTGNTVNNRDRFSVRGELYFELSNGVIRFSMLDTSIRTREVYVMNVKKIIGKYHRSLVINPLIAGTLALMVLSVNTILPAIVSLFSEQMAKRMEESVELISVYGVALGTLFVFIIIGALFALDLPTHIQSWRENKE